jgi:hypothetical protein
MFEYRASPRLDAGALSLPQHTQLIPPFSLWWCGMVYDYALWRDDADFVRARMPGVRAVVDAFLSYATPTADCRAARLNYVDWTTDPVWHRGPPPDGEGGVNGILNWQFALALTYAAALEDWLGEPRAQRATGVMRQRPPRDHGGFLERRARPVRGRFGRGALLRARAVSRAAQWLGGRR